MPDESVEIRARLLAVEGERDALRKERDELRHQTTLMIESHSDRVLKFLERARKAESSLATSRAEALREAADWFMSKDYRPSPDDVADWLRARSLTQPQPREEGR